jgi:hypothetical protein
VFRVIPTEGLVRHFDAYIDRLERIADGVAGLNAALAETSFALFHVLLLLPGPAQNICFL